MMTREQASERLNEERQRVRARLRVRAAIAAMQGLFSNVRATKVAKDLKEIIVASVEAADLLLVELDKEQP